MADTFELSLDRKQFDFDELRGPDDAVTLTVVDDSVHEVNTSYTTIAVIKVLSIFKNKRQHLENVILGLDLFIISQNVLIVSFSHD